MISLGLSCTVLCLLLCGVHCAVLCRLCRVRVFVFVVLAVLCLLLCGVLFAVLAVVWYVQLCNPLFLGPGANAMCHLYNRDDVLSSCSDVCCCKLVLNRPCT
jgi:hypothetical protein